MSERRKPDIETMELRKEFLDCSNSMTLEMKELADQIAKLTIAIEDWRKSGLGSMIKDYNDKKIFDERSIVYGKRIIFTGKMLAAFSLIGGTLAAIVYFIANGQWPMGNP